MTAVLLLTPDVVFAVGGWLTVSRSLVHRRSRSQREAQPRPRTLADEVEEWLAQQ